MQDIPDNPEAAPTVETGDPPKSDLWDEIGFHRPLGGFWYRLVLEMGTILIPVAFVAFALTILYPFPESLGYNKTFTAMFLLVFTVFDIGTANVLNRFIADSNIKNPKRMVAYIQYFIWYQMITGLVQITIVSVWALYVAPDTNVAYGIWILLAVTTKQYPGFPGVFKGALNALQQFNKKAAIDFIQGEAFQRITEIIFVLLGRWYGMNNPEIGEIMGIAIGMVFGLYLDDLIAMIVAGYYLAKQLKPYGIRFRDLFGVDFDWALVKECMVFGIKTGLPGILFANTKVIFLVLSLIYIPHYTTYIVLSDMAFQLMALTQRLVDQDFTPLFTEAYQTRKYKLCQYYNAHALRFFAINSGFAIAIMVIVASMFEEIFTGLGLYRYLLTVPFLIPALVNRATNVYERYPDRILIAAHRPNAVLFLNTFEEGGKLLCIFLTIVVFRVQDLGIFGVVYVLALGDYPAVMAKTIIAYIYVDRKIFKMKLMAWQTLVVPAVSCAFMFGLFAILKELVLVPLMQWNFIVALIIGIAAIIVLVFTLYFPITVLLGGWDENSLRDFRKAVKMSGPSKFLVVLMAKAIFATVKHAKLHDRFRYDETEAFTELKELVAMRDANRVTVLK